MHISFRFIGRFFLFSTMLLFLTGQPAFAALRTWTGLAGDGKWNTPGNWELSLLPTSVDDALIPGGASPYPEILSGDFVIVLNVTVQNGGSVSVSGGDFYAAGKLVVENGGAFLLNSGNVTVEDSFQGLEIAVDGSFQMNNGTLAIGFSSFPGKLTYNGDFQFNGGFIDAAPSSSLGGTGTFLWSDGEIRESFSSTGFSWVNSGTIQIMAGGSPVLGECDFTNDNAFILESGSSLIVSDSSTGGVSRFENGINGTLEGNGFIDFAASNPGITNTRLINNGIFSPGGFGAVGIIEVTGDFENSGIFKAEISSPGGIADADNLKILPGSGFGGRALLSGEIISEPLDGTYSDGQVFPIINYQLQSGTFATVNPSPPPGFTFDPVDYGPGSSSGAVTLTLQSTGPKEWDGSESSVWLNAQNWVGGAPPVDSDDILIPVVTPPNAFYPIYSAAASPMAYGTVTVEGELTIDTGAIFRAAFDVAEGGKLTNQGDLRLSADSTNAGTLRWTGGSILLDEDTAFTNAATGRIECDNGTAGADLVLISNPLSVFDNAGDFVKTGIGGAVVEVETFYQDGVFEVSGGKLVLKPTVSSTSLGRYSGEFRLANDAELILGKGNHKFAESNIAPIGDRRITGQGRFLIGDPSLTNPTEFPNVFIYNNLVLDPGVSVEIFSGSTTVVDTPHTITGGGRLVLDDATSGAMPPTMYLDFDLTVEGPLRIAGGSVDGEGDLFVNGPFEWTGGLLAGYTMIEVPKIVLESGATVDNAFIGTTDGAGTTLQLDGRDLILLGGATVYDGRLEFGQSAKMEIGDSGATGSSAVLNVQNDPAIGMTFAASDANAGLGYGVFNYGAIAGSGLLTFESSILGNFPAPEFGNTAAIAPGNETPGALIFDVGNYDHFDGELQVNLQGTATGEWDKMEVTGPVNLGGVLAVDLDFTPQFGDEFVVMTHGGIMSTGQFSGTSLKIGGVDQPFADYFDIFYDANQVILKYISETPLAALSVSVSPGPDAGSVTMTVADGAATSQTFTCPDVCAGAYPIGTYVDLTATANEGYMFDRWEYPTAAASNVSEDGNTAYVMLQEDFPIAAVFIPTTNMATLSIVVSPPGSGAVSGQAMSMIIDPETGEAVPGEGFTFTCPDQCIVTVPTGGSVSLTAASTATGYSFSGWQGADSASGASAYVQMSANRQVTASFFRPSPPPYDNDTPVITDNCPDDPLKIEPGVCGCGVPDIDTDGDETYDCKDGCPEDPDKTEPGVCGCGVPDIDTDGDETYDCKDGCPEDPGKIEPGICRCGIPDTDSDGDGLADCLDGCPGDPEKTAPGQCGCGVSETGDWDGDGTPDCGDLCPSDPDRTTPGACGCGIPETDSDGDGTPDCLDDDGPVDPNLPPSIPGEPQAIAPDDGAFLATSDVVLEGLILLSGGGGQSIETHWWFRPADKRVEFLDIHQTTYGGIVKYRPAGLIPGLRYVWRFGYRNPLTGEMIWTDLRTFTVGTPVDLNGPMIAPGADSEDYAMRTFAAWTVAPDIVELLENFIGTYDDRFFRIGSWDPEESEYIEFSQEIFPIPFGLNLFPGKGFWFLAREGLDPVFEGVPVTLKADINVNLGFDEDSERGWNQIAAPNDADYRWGEVELIAFEPADDPEEFVPTFGPVPLSQLAPDNPYIHPELWRFVDGSYISLLPGDEDAVILREEGYWVEAKRDNICLVFRKSSQRDLTAEETLLVRTLRKARGFADAHLGPRFAVAQSGDTPPMPMGALSDYSGDDPSSRVDGGGGACFIEGASR